MKPIERPLDCPIALDAPIDFSGRHVHQATTRDILKIAIVITTARLQHDIQMQDHIDVDFLWRSATCPAKLLHQDT